MMPEWDANEREALRQTREDGRKDAEKQAHEKGFRDGIEAAAKKLPEIMQDCWNDWCADTGCFPDDFTSHGKTLSFSAGAWANNCAAHLRTLAPSAAPTFHDGIEAAAKVADEWWNEWLRVYGRSGDGQGKGVDAGNLAASAVIGARIRNISPSTTGQTERELALKESIYEIANAFGSLDGDKDALKWRIDAACEVAEKGLSFEAAFNRSREVGS